MNDAKGKTASSLAITEKRPHKSGGFVGMFFQLFDWNRRFEKKKLFSKKLLPPARAKQVSKKFGGDEKLPKLRLIADENSGGFPHGKKIGTCVTDSEQKHGTRSPGLVARLMGLESLPAVPQNKLKKAPSSEIGRDIGEKSASDHSGFGKEDFNLEKGGTKLEMRPEKLQKTGSFERRPVTRFGAEALQFKNVLSRSRKHHPKFASPVKSPKSLSGRNATRLIGAAAKILEPGLQTRNRAKCALTYSNTMHHAPAMMEATTASSQDLLESSNYYMSAARSLKGQSSCRNCGNLIDMVDTKPNIEEQPYVFVSSVRNYVDPSLQGSERSKPTLAMSSCEQEKESDFQKGEEHSASFAAQATEHIRPRAVFISDKMPLDREGKIQWHLTSQQCRPRMDSPSSICFKHKTQRQNQVSLGRDRVSPRSMLNNLQSNRVASATNAITETKDFVASNRSVSCQTRSRMPAKVDNFKFDRERKFGNRRDDSLSPMRKRRSMNASRQGESSGFVSSTFDNQRNISCNAMTGKEMGRNVHSMNHICIENRLAHLGESNRTSGSGNKDDIISFTFSSPMKHKSGIPAEMEERRNQNDAAYNSNPQKDSILAENDVKTCFQTPFSLSGDTLGALLEQKLKELTCQEEDDLAFGGTPPKRTSAMILQELIFALTAEKPLPQDDLAVRSDGKNISCYGGHLSNTHTNITEAKPKTARASVKYSHDNDHLSPGSVLEASFSNDSCVSNSVDDSLGHKLHADSMNCSYDEPQPIEPDADLLDCATSISKERAGRDLVTDLLSHIAEVLCSIDLADTRLKGSKLTHAKDVIQNAELVFRIAVLHNPDGIVDFSISHFLLDELETLASVMWTNFSGFIGLEDTKEGNLLKGFLFDCVVEYLDLRYGQYPYSGFKAWTRMPLCKNSEMLIQEVVGEVRRWTGFAGLIPDEIIEREMSCGLGKWTDFKIEAFEAGIEIDGDILQVLVDEVMIDIWECRLDTSGLAYSPANC